MPIHIACPHCRQPLRIPAEAENTTIQCPHCHGLARVPRTAGTKPPAAAPPPAGPPPDPARNPWAGITSMVVGIVGLAFSCLPMCSAPLGVLAVIFAIVGLVYYKGGRGMATAGLVLGACGIVISVTLVIVALMWPTPIKPARQEPAKVSFRPTRASSAAFAPDPHQARRTIAFLRAAIGFARAARRVRLLDSPRDWTASAP